jgi:hypothetical protein
VGLDEKVWIDQDSDYRHTGALPVIERCQRLGDESACELSLPVTMK